MGDSVEVVQPKRTLLRSPAAARYIAVNPRLVIDRAWRGRVGLFAYRIGGGLRFAVEDLDVFLERHRETPRDAA